MNIHVNEISRNFRRPVFFNFSLKFSALASEWHKTPKLRCLSHLFLAGFYSGSRLFQSIYFNSVLCDGIRRIFWYFTDRFPRNFRRKFRRKFNPWNVRANSCIPSWCAGRRRRPWRCLSCSLRRSCDASTVHLLSPTSRMWWRELQRSVCPLVTVRSSRPVSRHELKLLNDWRDRHKTTAANTDHHGALANTLWRHRAVVCEGPSQRPRSLRFSSLHSATDSPYECDKDGMRLIATRDAVL